MALIDTLKDIIAAEADTPPTRPQIHTPDSDRRLAVSAITIEIMQGRHASVTSRDIAARVIASLSALGLEITRKTEGDTH